MFEAVGGVEHAGNGPADHGAFSLHGHGPACVHKALQFRAAGVPRQQARGAFLLCPEQEHLPGVGVRGALLHVEIVAVVPAHHQAEVPDRRVGCRARAHRHAGSAVEDPQVAAVPGRLAVICGEPGDVSGRQDLLQGGLHPVQVTVVRDHHHRAPAGLPNGGHRPGEEPGPAVRTEALQGAQDRTG